MFVRATAYTSYEMVPGDVLEFGVFAGASLALLARAQMFNDARVTRRIVGFDSFAGLPPSEHQHPRWPSGLCSVNHWWHPLVPRNAPVSPRVIVELFRACRLPPPELEVGFYAETLSRVVPAKYSQAAILHIDCDLYESTCEVLESVGTILQDGTVVLF